MRGKLSVMLVDDGVNPPDYGLYVVWDATRPASGNNITLLLQDKKSRCEQEKRKLLKIVAALGGRAR
jgi:hypothetical protein